MPRALTAPPDDRSMWRRVLARIHPDAPGGDHSLFIWTANVRDFVCGDGTKSASARTFAESHEEPARVPFDTGESFDALTRRIVALELPAPYASLISLLADCRSARDGTLYRQQYRGATYKQLAYVAHLVGMTHEERARWYRVAESLPLSQRHAGHILERLQRMAA